jgi:hypothetical protein
MRRAGTELRSITVSLSFEIAAAKRDTSKNRVHKTKRGDDDKKGERYAQ